MKKPGADRGDHTRDRLLDAVESLVAQNGFAGLSHRAIARRAGVHGALVHYHFGTVDRLLEEAVARRAAPVVHAQFAALAQVTLRPRFTLADVVQALWSPYEALRHERATGWSNYLCLVARLANAPEGRSLHRRFFDDVDRAASAAIRRIHPHAEPDAIDAALGHVHAVFDRAIRASHCDSPGSKEPGIDWPDELIAFAAAGLERVLVRSVRVARVAAAD